ncbi:hypothetical protein [Sphingomonas oligoaromativorans]|uniref:hypothetical protein n=1 Tax=Sphingomonas oligoaromativorans TaxID=575322 RepID=UPI0014213AF6|nr:hypothetical protein [Sphingomonas oligoaromativorans]NIJ32084.1 Mg2+/Co2+ transporter CorB [Sphingomonas oligoaromativorans]
MDTDEYEWSPRPPNMRERVIAALLVAALVIAGASSYAGWRLFGDYDKAVAAGITILGVIVFTRLMPTAWRR